MNTLKLYCRNLIRNKVFSVITVGSFAISLAVVILLSSFLASEFNYDKHLLNIDRLYRIVTSRNETGIPEQAKELLLDQSPEFEAITHIVLADETLVYDNNVFNAKTINSDENLFKVLSLEFIAGNPNGIFNDIHNAVITESLARKLFGEENALGKIINVSHRENLQVAGIIKDFPEKSTIHGELICSTNLKLRYAQSCYNNNCTYFYETLALIKPDITANSLNDKISSIIPVIKGRENVAYSLSPFKNIYFNTSLLHDSFEHANLKLLKMMTLLTVILLFLAIFNYINLSIAQNTNRLKEFGIKQILGNSQFRVYWFFINEALLTTLLSTFIALFITILIKPVFVNLFGKEFSVFSLLNSPLLIFAVVTALIIIALISAIYPAYLATKVTAKDLLQKRHFIKVGKYDIRKSLCVIQFAASIAIIVALTVITKQINYIKTTDLGFNTEQLIRIPIHWEAGSKVETVKNALRVLPGVKDVCHTQGALGEIWSSSANENGSVSMIASDASFVKTFQIPILNGRNFWENEEKKVCLINKTALQNQGWDTFEGKSLFGYEVVGLIDNFHYQDLYTKIGALMITNGEGVSYIIARILPQNFPQTLSLIKNEYKRILPDFEYSFQFYDDFINSLYQQEEKRAAAIRIITIIAIFISCIGLIGLIEFSTKSKIKEIGIRKVNGAKISEVMLMLNKDFVKWVAIAFVIATPIAWYAMHKWLENFAYKTELSWWIFAMAGLLALGIALLTVSFQSYKVAVINPIESLRYE